MYCDKLINIVHHSDSSKYGIDSDVVQKLDKFIKEKTTLRERENLNPIKFAIEMQIEQETALMSFVLGARCNLFQIRAYFSCENCEENLELNDIHEEFECTCERKINPFEHRERIFLYFNLLEKPTICIWEQNKPAYQLDFLEQGDFNKGNFTLADLDHIAGPGSNDDLISLREVREEKMKAYLKGENDS